MIRATSMIGDEDHVRERIGRYRSCGITELTLNPLGRSSSERLDTLGRAVSLIAEATG